MGKPRLNSMDSSLLKVPQFRCEFEGCQKYFNKLSRLKYHQNTHLEKKPFKCDHPGCSSAYYRPNHLKRHVESIHKPDKLHSNSPSEKSTPATFRCEHEGCAASFDSQNSLYYHTKRKHSFQQYRCSFCEKRFSKKWMFKEHEASHSNASPFQCNFEACKQQFKDYRMFKAHKRDHAKKEKTAVKLTCSESECQETFTKWSDLVSHKKLLHPSGALVDCPTCNKPFTKRMLKIHEQVHQEDRVAFQCPYINCPRFYLHQRNLTHHIRIKHDDGGYSCKICERKLSSNQKLQLHVQVVHGGKRKRKKKSSKSSSLIAKLASMENADWEINRTGPSRYIRQKHNYIQFPTNVSDELLVQDDSHEQKSPAVIAVGGHAC